VRVLAVARGEGDLATLAAAYPGRCVSLAGDLRDPELPQRAVDEAFRVFQRIDILVANTGGPPTVMPLEAKEDDFASAFDVVFYPGMRLVKAAAAPMMEQGWGRILILSSTSVKAPKPFLCLSAAARSALWAWSKSAAPRLMERGVTINALLAGPHDTDRARQLGVKNRPMGRPEHFGAIVASLCGQHTSFVTGTGQMIDGGEFGGI
jgi:3-oxoacyl-[acyl-carrier protein] reductase